MFFFDGCKCPYCGEEFTSSDDVVACPVCGTPHHRDCFRENGACAFDSEHENGYVWKRDEAASEKKEEKAAVNVCVHCGAENAPDRLWCEKCGSMISAGAQDKRSAGTAAGNGTDPQSSPWQSENGYFSMGGEVSIPDGELIEDVPAGDLKRFIKESAYYYVPLFAAFSRLGRKISFNMFALFTHGLWFLSRKMYLLGTAVLTVQLAIHAFQTYCAVELDDLMAVYASGDMSAAYAMVADLMVERPVLLYGMMISTVLYYAIMIGSGLLSNWLYMKHCIRKVKKINARSKNAEEFNEQLSKKGGGALALAVGCAVLYVALRVFLQYLIQGYFPG